MDDLCTCGSPNGCMIHKARSKKSLTITKGDRLTMKDLDIKLNHIALHDVKYGGEDALDIDLTPDESRQVAATLLGISIDELP